MYLDTNSHPSTLVSSGASASYHMQNLSCGTTYYWSITSVDRYGAITEGPVWHFTTTRGPSVKNMHSGNTYSTLTAAYGSAGDGDEIRCQGVAITDNFTANNPNNISVTIKGGYDCTFTSSPDKTTLVGAPVISRGTVTLRDFIISN